MTAESALQRSSSVGAGSLGRQPDSLADVLERVLDKGIVIAGDIVVSILDIELLTLKLRLFISSAETAREMGLDWWSHDPFFSGRPAEPDREIEDGGRATSGEDGGEVEALRRRVAALEKQLHQRDELTSATHEDTEGTEALVTGPNDRDALDRIADDVTPEVLAAALEQARERATARLADLLTDAIVARALRGTPRQPPVVRHRVRQRPLRLRRHALGSELSRGRPRPDRRPTGRAGHRRRPRSAGQPGGPRRADGGPRGPVGDRSSRRPGPRARHRRPGRRGRRPGAAAALRHGRRGRGRRPPPAAHACDYRTGAAGPDR